MKEMTPINDVIENVTNIYRTDKHIVYQSVHVCYADNSNTLVSDDVYFVRTPERDAAYERAFGHECVLHNRRRMKVAAYTRRYVE